MKDVTRLSLSHMLFEVQMVCVCDTDIIIPKNNIHKMCFEEELVGK